MRILHLASSNRWTGAAAPAFAEAEALRGAGARAHYAYVGGYLLESRLRGVAFAHPVMHRKQDPWSFMRTVAAVRRLVRRFDIEVIHAHLTYDHVVALAAAGRAVRVFRTFHSRRALRSDPFTRLLLRRTSGVATVNAAHAGSAIGRSEGAMFTAPPLNGDEFSPAGENVRGRYGVQAAETVIGCIGKIAQGRGFEQVLRAFAAFRRMSAGRLLVIGHGPHQAALEALAGELGVAADVIWAGYHERDLAGHYRAMDQMLFTAPGSDEGHRAVLEAMGCGVPVVCYAIEGVAELLGPLAPQLLCSGSTAEAAAELMRGLSCGPAGAIRDAVRQQAARYSYAPAADLLLRLYQQQP